MKKIITIAGSDTSGGAGIQADLRTFAKYNLYGMTALTVIVTMDPASWQHGVYPVPVGVIEKQIETAFDGVGVDAIKTGMLPTAEIIETVSKHLEKCNKNMPVTIDPVMVCKGEEPMFPEHAEAIAKMLIKHATITTPNLFEAGQLSGMGTLKSIADAKRAAEKILKAGAKNVVIKGVGHLESANSAGDLFFDGNEYYMVEGKRIDTTHTHGLGCTFAAHVASQLCLGVAPREACIRTKQKITKGLENHFKLSDFAGTLNFEKSFE